MHLLQTSTRRGSATAHETISFRPPTKDDGRAVQALIASCGTLDGNSLYCNLLQCTHFADTCRVAERGGEIVGWISGYLPPGEADTLFIWQVGVSASARGEGIGKKLIGALLEASSCRHITYIKTSITPDNAASWALFASVADAFDAPLRHSAWFERNAHLGGKHPTEHLLAIGPLRSAAKAA